MQPAVKLVDESDEKLRLETPKTRKKQEIVTVISLTRRLLVLSCRRTPVSIHEYIQKKYKRKNYDEHQRHTTKENIQDFIPSTEPALSWFVY